MFDGDTAPQTLLLFRVPILPTVPIHPILRYLIVTLQP